MSRALEAWEQLYSEIDKKNWLFVGTINPDLVETAITAIRLMEDTEQPERKKGTWRHYEGMLTCSVCGAEFDDDITEYFGGDVPRFCPDCGADLRGDDHDKN